MPDRNGSPPPPLGPLFPLFRMAAPGDAVQISALYEEEYCPPGGGDARAHYPFPQFLDPDWVAEAVRRKALCWIVAELDGVVVGSAGAVRNIGSPSDRVAEVFGIVVRRSARGRNIGIGLLSYLDAMLGDEARFVLCEARTGDSRGWKVARHCAFEPIGFEPFAHTTPVGSESMIPTARLRPEALARRAAAPPASHAVQSLAALVRPPPAPATERPVLTPAEPPRRMLQSPLGIGPASSEPCDANDPLGRTSRERMFRVRRDDRRGSTLLSQWEDRLRPHASVVGLRRLEGEDRLEKRYDRRHYIGVVEDSELACARVVWDRTDRRARILDLRSEVSGLEGPLIEQVVSDLTSEAGDNPLILVVDVRADARELQAQLEALAFLPTIYYPAFIADGPSRVDAVQYTRLDHRPIDDSLQSVSVLDWEDASRVVAHVAKSARGRA